MKLIAEYIPILSDELSELCQGMAVKDVAGLPPRDLLLILDASDREGPAVRRIRLSASRQTPRFHLQHGRTFRHTGPPGPFPQQVQAELLGARLHRVSAVRGDRIALLEFRQTPSGEPRSLLIELFGPHSNLYLLGPQDHVLGWLVAPHQPKDGSAPRIALGRPWQAPGGQAPGGSHAPFEEAFPLPDREAPQEGAPASWRVEALLEPIADAKRIEEERKTLLSRLQRKLSSARSKLKGLEKRRTAADQMERVRQDGELLKASLGQWKRGDRSIEVQDWFVPEAPLRKLPLDPKLDPNGNVKKVFARYKKLQRSAQHVGAEIEAQTERIAELESWLARAEPCEDPAALEQEAIAARILDPRQVADVRKKKAPTQRLPYRSFYADDGTEIRVGRNARDNDELTLRHARGSDLWLHTADAPGSHVILKVQRHQSPSDEAVLDAATLAVHFSPLKNAGKANVHVVHQKRVQKPKGRQTRPGDPFGGQGSLGSHGGRPPQAPLTLPGLCAELGLAPKTRPLRVARLMVSETRPRRRR